MLPADRMNKWVCVTFERNGNEKCATYKWYIILSKCSAIEAHWILRTCDRNGERKYRMTKCNRMQKYSMKQWRLHVYMKRKKTNENGRQFVDARALMSRSPHDVEIIVAQNDIVEFKIWIFSHFSRFGMSKYLPSIGCTYFDENSHST